MRNVPKRAAPNDDFVRVQSVQHAKERVSRRINRHNGRRHALRPVHAVGVAAVANTVAWRCVFAFEIGTLLCRDPRAYRACTFAMFANKLTICRDEHAAAAFMFHLECGEAWPLEGSA